MLKRKGQSILEYAALLMIVIAAIMIMQVFVKRSIQGRFKQSSEEIGDQFSAGNSTEIQKRELVTNQTIHEETTTKGPALTDLGWGSGNITGTVEKDTFSYSHRQGGDAKTTTERKTDSAKKETFKWDKYKDDTYDDFVIPGGEEGGP